MISVIIPTYKNRELFLNNLKHNLPFLKGCEVIVVNDDPSESLKKNLITFKNVILIENTENLGFGMSVNQGVKNTKGSYLLLLNNDVLLSDNSYLNSFKHFENDPNLFAVSFSQEEKDGTIVGKNAIFWKNGFFHHKRVIDNHFGNNGWAEAGSCLIDKKKFLELKGFDPAYSPFYWEDVDLSYRATKKGWKILFDPQIKVIHHHESTISKYYSREKIKTIAFRNQLIFTWKNINNIKTILEHLINLPIIITKGKLPFIKGFFQALIKTWR